MSNRLVPQRLFSDCIRALVYLYGNYVSLLLTRFPQRGWAIPTPTIAWFPVQHMYELRLGISALRSSAGVRPVQRVIAIPEKLCLHARGRIPYNQFSIVSSKTS